MSMKTAAAYIRVSTDDQIEYSPDSQLKALRDYAKRNDMILPEEYVYIDEGISGRTTSKRPAFNRMIGTAKSKPKPFARLSTNPCCASSSELKWFPSRRTSATTKCQC